MTTVARKPILRTAVVEALVTADRAHVWSTLVSRLEAGEVGPATHAWPEVVLSFEPPWRRVGRLTIVDGAGREPSPLVEHTAVVRDDGDSCLLVWAAVVEVPHDASTEVDASCDEVVAALDAAMRRWASDVAESAVRA